LVERKSISRRIFLAFAYAFTTILALSCLLPLVHTVALSLSGKTAAISGTVTFIPIDFTTMAYKAILEDKQYFVSFFVSVMRVISGGLLNMVFTVLMAYPLSKSTRHFPKRNWYMWYMVFTMLFGGGLIPFYILISKLGMMDNFLVLILPSAIPIFNIIVLMNYFRGLPEELSEAARIDGASPWIVLFRIFLPLAIPCLATLALFSMVGHWNNFFDGLIFIESPGKLPLQSYLKMFTIDTNAYTTPNMTAEQLQRIKDISSNNFNAAKLVISMIPILAIYPFLQKYFVTGLVVGSVKG